jgi:hypothetical protein
MSENIFNREGKMNAFRWKETWRDSSEFDWLDDMKDCDEAIESLRTHIENCDRKYDSKSINNAEDLILDIEDEKVEREFCSEWPTNEQVEKYCGVYPCLEYVSRETFRRTGEVWKLTPQLLKTRWTSELDFMQWSLVMYSFYPQEVRIEPIPVTYVSQKKEREINIGWDPYDLG